MKQLISTALIAFADLNTDRLLEQWNEFYAAAQGILLGLAVSITLILGVIVGVQFMLARGEEEKIKKAKTATKGIVIGWAVAMAILIFAPMIIDIIATWGNVDIIQ